MTTSPLTPNTCPDYVVTLTRQGGEPLNDQTITAASDLFTLNTISPTQYELIINSSEPVPHALDSPYDLRITVKYYSYDPGYFTEVATYDFEVVVTDPC